MHAAKIYSPFLIRVFAWGLVGLVIVYATLIVKDFANYIGAYPYLAVDDGLANISFVIVDAGRYGFLSSPLQAPNGLPRHDGFFNYGPWYFYLGAFLTWIFGYSLSLLRAIHLVVILGAVIVAYLWFRREKSNVAATVFALGILHCFQVAQWPMVRPDIMVSFFALTTIIFSGIAINSGRDSWWLGAGFSAASAAFTHLIAWSLVPASAFVLLIAHSGQLRSAWRSRSIPKQVLKNVGLLTVGGMIGTLIFYASFGFRIHDHLATLIDYKSFVLTITVAHGGQVLEIFNILQKHLASAYGYLPQTARFAVATVLIFGWLVCIFHRRLGLSQRKLIASYLVPPLIIWTGYIASLAFYPNYHAGYAILSQVLAFWTAGALAVVALSWIDQHRGLADRLGLFVILAIVAGFGFVIIKPMFVHTSYKSQIAHKWVPITSYMDQFLNDIPRGSHAWGTIMYGIENPGRIQLIQFGEGLTLVSKMSESERVALSPEVVVWGYSENRDSVINVLSGSPSPLRRVSELFPKHHYILTSITQAAPYGSTRVYARVPENTESSGNRCAIHESNKACLPVARVFDPKNGIWRDRLGTVLTLTAKPVPAQVFRVGYSADPAPIMASRSVAAVLPRGAYLLEVHVKTGHDMAIPRMLAVSSRQEVRQTMSELGPDFDSTPYFPGDETVYLVHRHDGGLVFLSQFDVSAGAGISAIKAYPIASTRLPAGNSMVALPPFDEWVPDTSSGVHGEKRQDGFTITGNDTQFGYQLASPVLPVTRHQSVTVQINYITMQGRVCPGVLDGKAQTWIATPNKPRSEIVFLSGSNSSVIVVMANCNDKASGNLPSRFVLQSAKYTGADASGLYTDRLMQSFAR